MHALYKPGSKLRLSAIVRDAAGHIVTSGCTPEPSIADETAANRNERAGLEGMGVVFENQPGVFTISVHCKEHPEITSEGHSHANLNFETANCTNEFAASALAPGAPGSNDPPK